MTMRALLVGHGRMGRLIEGLAPSQGVEISGVISHDNARDLSDRGRWETIDVVIDFSHAQAFLQNLGALRALERNLVIGTSGWHDQAERVRSTLEEAGVGVVAAANFSIGAAVLDALCERAGQLFEPLSGYDAFIHEAHHAAKRDAPSGTAVALKGALARGGFTRQVDVSSTRAGFNPGTHTVGFDGLSETITLEHTVRDRGTFAQGALVAARWLQGRSGWFTMRDVLGIRP
jgi:4-hydroxy-tetrahydrodipicolinate reductase